MTYLCFTALQIPEFDMTISNCDKHGTIFRESNGVNLQWRKSHGQLQKQKLYLMTNHNFI